MDTIDSHVMQEAEQIVHRIGRDVPIIHTVTITLNGSHGGADIRIAGFSTDTLDDRVVIEGTIA
jgi:hypothetical protein